MHAGVGQWNFLRGNIDKAGDRAEGHRLPAVSAEPGRHRHEYTLLITRLRRLDGAPSGQVNAGGPVLRHKILRRYQSAIEAINDVEKSILRSLHEHFAQLTIDGQFGEH